MNNLLQELKKSKNILILTHMSPDGDALGSSVAMKYLLKGMNIKSDCVIDEEIPRQYTFLSDEFIIQKEAKENYDLIIFVDCAGKDRCSVIYPKNLKTCGIDHHMSNLKDCDINIIENTAATAEIIYDMFLEYNIPLCKSAAIAVYTAIYTDTGGFSFSNTTKKTHETAAVLCGFDFDRAYIARKAYQEKSLIYSKIYSYIIENLVMLDNSRVAIGYLPYDIYISLNATSDDTEGLSQVLRSIIDVECGVFLTEKEKGIIKGSVRTNDIYDANNIAASFGGGGHLRAAGFKTNLTYLEIKDKINEWIFANQQG